MKKLLTIFCLLLLPLTASAAEVTITNYDGSNVRVQISDADYAMMIKWNSTAPSLGYPLMRAIPYKGPVGFSIGRKAAFHTLLISQNQNKIELIINPETTTTEAQNFAQLLQRCVGNHIKITIKYMPNDPRSRQ